MLEDEFPVCCIHSNMEKQERDKSFFDFKNGKYRVLISSDITARGIDIQQVSVVINFDFIEHGYEC
jgi:translation initiation factor 4A